jgi:hypothetical protein
MAIRVPLLLQKSTAVIYRLDTVSTQAFDPPGEATAGYNSLLSEPIAYDSGAGTARLDSRRELPPVRVPCQVEVPSFEALQQYGPGIVENTVLILVTHRQDLQNLGLLDPITNSPKLKKHDRVSAIERFGAVAGISQQKLASPGLFVFEVRPASWGFGPEGHDLELLFLEDRAKAQAV